MNQTKKKLRCATQQSALVPCIGTFTFTRFPIVGQQIAVGAKAKHPTQRGQAAMRTATIVACTFAGILTTVLIAGQSGAGQSIAGTLIAGHGVGARILTRAMTIA
jgi:hypothetical protein